MAKYSTHEAKTHLSKLIASALKGDEVIITRGDEPVAILAPIKKKEKKLKLPMPGEITSKPVRLSPDAFSPLSDEELEEWELS